MISPYIQTILDSNDMEYISILRYGPRFACLKVRYKSRIGFFKSALPLEEQKDHRPDDYFWSHHDGADELNRRLQSEAAILDFLGTELGPHFEPRMIAQGTEPALWSLRTFVKDSAFAYKNSNFMFDALFYERVTPQLAFDLFASLRTATSHLPVKTAQLIANTEASQQGRLDWIHFSLEYLQTRPEFLAHYPIIRAIFRNADTIYDQSQFVISHGEPFAPHIVFSEHGQLGLIDWENVSLNDPLLDLAAIHLRTFPDSPWQTEFDNLIRQAGLIDGDGLRRWRIEQALQSIENHKFLTEGGSFGDADFDAMAISHFEHVILELAHHK